MKTNNYKLIGAGLIIISIIGMLFTTGTISDIQSNLSPQSTDPSVKILSDNELTGRVNVIIELDYPTASAVGVQAQDIFIQDVELMGGDVLDRFIYLDNSILTSIDASKLDAIAMNPNVKAIIPDEYVWFVPQQDEDIAETTSTQQYWDNIYDQLDVEALWAKGYTGKNTVVAIVDTGINSKLPCFQRDGKSIVIDSLRVYGEYVMYHGTACAVCVASQDPVRKGVAPGASLLNVEVFQANGGAQLSDIKKGWDWVVQWKNSHPDFYVICSNSLGANPWYKGSYNAGAAQLNVWADAMVSQHDIPMIVAAGNGNPLMPVQLKMNCPGESKYSLTVGAVDSNGELAPFSCRGVTKDGTKKPDVVAPGVSIPMFDEYGRPKTASGTSFATPFTAGVAALIAEAHPDYNAFELQSAIKNGADGTATIPAKNAFGVDSDVSSTSYDTTFGNGLVDAEAALTAITGVPAEKTFNPPFFLIFAVLGVIIFLYAFRKKGK